LSYQAIADRLGIKKTTVQAVFRGKGSGTTRPKVTKVAPPAEGKGERMGSEGSAPDGNLDWYYGPTEWDADPGKMWHRGCPAGHGEVWGLEGGYCCSECDAEQPPDEESAT
jgi:hypothetical protein